MKSVISIFYVCQSVQPSFQIGDKILVLPVEYGTTTYTINNHDNTADTFSKLFEECLSHLKTSLNINLKIAIRLKEFFPDLNDTDLRQISEGMNDNNYYFSQANIIFRDDVE